MDTREFLEAVWPTRGIFCLATPYLVKGATKTTYSHKVVTSIDDAMQFINWKRETDNVFFAIHSLKSPGIPNPNKRPKADGSPGLDVRTHANMLEGKAFFFDLDIGEEEKKYQTREEAISGLEAFLFCTGLPDPMVTSSGGGYHVYWLITDPIASSVWRGHAAKLYHLARKFGLRVDPARTTDQSSVLRVVGTYNHKNGGKRAVEIVAPSVPTPTPDFIAALDTLVGTDQINVPTAVERVTDALGSNTQQTYTGDVPTLTEVSNVCEHVQDFILNADTVGNNEWYTIGAGVVQYVEDGIERALELAAEHPGRDAHAEADIIRWNTNFAPASCGKVDAACGGDACSRCPFAGLAPGPAAIALKVRKGHAPAPAQPMFLSAPQATTVSVAPPMPVCPIPPNYARVMKGIQHTRTPDPRKPPVHDILIPYDFWPYEAFGKTELEPAFSSWSAGIWQPNPTKLDPAPVEQVLVKVTSAQVTDIKALHVLLSNHGLHVPAANMIRVREYMLAYIRSLQEYARANAQYDHLGWADKKRTRFVMPTMVHNIDGTTDTCTLSALAKPALQLVTRAGTQSKQFDALQFYNEEKYLGHQFAIGCALGSVALYATRYHGSVVALVGETSASKSTALYAAASLWGRPEDYVINGTNRGMTVTAREDRVLTLANLPAIVDEITRMPDQEAKDFVFAATQPRLRDRCNSDGTLKPQRITLKSMITLVSANTSIHHLLEQNNAAGTAASMRALEIVMQPVAKGSQQIALADQFLRDLGDHHGHIGPAFLEFYVANRDMVEATIQEAVRKLNSKYDLPPAERYWTGTAATTLVCMGFAYDMGLLPYEPKLVNRWVVEHLIPDNRGTVAATLASKAPEVLVMNFISEIIGEIIMTSLGMANTLNMPSRIKGHWDESLGLMYIRRDAFREWCSHRAGCDHNDLIRQLNHMGIVTSVDKKITLGAGTQWAVGRTLCFVVSLKHPMIAAQTPQLKQAATVTQLQPKVATP